METYDWDTKIQDNLTPQLVLLAFVNGVNLYSTCSSFDNNEDHKPHLVFADNPSTPILSSKNVHIPKKLAKTIKQAWANEAKPDYDIRINRNFRFTYEKCFDRVGPDGEKPTPELSDSRFWDLYEFLHQNGFAHSLECWKGNEFQSGLVGFTLGRIFVGRTMVHKVPGTGHMPLMHLMARLDAGGFAFCDLITPADHLRKFNILEATNWDHHFVGDTRPHLASQKAEFFPDMSERDLILGYLERQKSVPSFDPQQIKLALHNLMRDLSQETNVPLPAYMRYSSDGPEFGSSPALD